MKQYILGNTDVIHRIADILARKYSNDELAYLYNDTFAADGEVIAYNGDETFTLEKKDE